MSQNTSIYHVEGKKPVASSPSGDHIALVGKYTYVKGGSEKYTQECSLNADGTATFKEGGDTRTETWERSGSGCWKVEEDYVRIYCDLKKVSKSKGNVPIPGFDKNEEKLDANCAVELKLKEFQTAPPAGPTAPKNRWTKL
ncbi:hypothetical protein PROFUN_10114 [Planoprotostelium fungivorum]|uniref:Uncharacterized protein n=1 Tax=Planoprotostelium fungivorum TaxID=1890364 RepID=A0A2P6NEM9_9EUKA|nr:hypothetical protein PROFUN_10114 [Planoprotostelium fungivorum]